MSPLRLIILLVAAGAAIAAVFLVRSMQAPAPAAATAAVAPAPVARPADIPAKQVLVAKKDIAVGHFLVADDLGWQDWPEAAQTKSFSTKKETPDALEKAVGAVAKSAMVEGEPIVASKIVHPGSGGWMSAILDPGMRAVSIDISAETGAGGFIQPNDHVDVVLTREIDPAAEAGGRPVAIKARSHAILENVKVLAIDAIYGPPPKQGEGGVLIGTRATLELGENDAALVNAGQKAGRLSLVLRSVADLNGHSGATSLGRSMSGGGAGEGVRIYRYGAEGVATVPAS